MTKRIYEYSAGQAAKISAVFMALFGLWIILPWDAFTGRPAYMLMEDIMPQIWWGILFIGIGVFRLWGAMTNNYSVARISAFAAFALWGTAAICFWISDWRAPVAIIGTYLAVQSAHHYLMTADVEEYE